MSNSCPKCGTAILIGNDRLCPRCALSAALACDGKEAAANTLVLDDLPRPGEKPGDTTLVLPDNNSWHQPPLPGAKVTYVGDYELLEMIARGGMGVVYRARQRSLNRVVALKMLLGGNLERDEFKQRFQQEAEMAARLHHPNIVPIFEVGEHEGQPYYSMEYVEGSTLAQLCRGQLMPSRQAAEYVKTATEAVDYAHRRGVLHRDLKPSNILIGLDGRLRITDFGLARLLKSDRNLTLSGVVLGTPGYLPPEQASATHGQVGVCSDVYALGAVLYHLLTGRPPFVAGSVAETLRQVLETEPLSPRRLYPEVPRDLETICLKCLAKTPADRYSNAAELAREFGSWLDHKPIQARSATVRMRRAKHTMRRPLVAVPLALMLLLATTSACLLWTTRQPKQPNRDSLPPPAASATNHTSEQKLEVVISGRSGNQVQPGQFDPNRSLKSFYSPDPSVGYDFSGAPSGAMGPATNQRPHRFRRPQHDVARPETETAAPK